MGSSRGARSFLATIVGYLLMALVAYVLLQMLVGTIFWLIRTVVVVLVLGGLLVLYLNLKATED